MLPMKVRDVMVREVITVDENSSVKEAVDVMNEFQIGSLIVLEKGKAKGIVTERDFLRRVIAEAGCISVVINSALLLLSKPTPLANIKG